MAEAAPTQARLARLALVSPAQVLAAPLASETVLTPTAVIPRQASSSSVRRVSERLPASVALQTPGKESDIESARPSKLAAETAALDAALSASAAGAYQRALSLLAQYQHDFPNGALRADAEVATIQTLAAAVEHSQATRRALSFLAEYPNDPHSATLKRLYLRCFSRSPWMILAKLLSQSPKAWLSQQRAASFC